MPKTLLALLTTCLPLAAQDFDVAKAAARLRLIGMGDYILKQGGHPPMAAADVDLCLQALGERSDEALLTKACRALRQLAGKEFFAAVPPATRGKLVTALIGLVPHADDGVGSAAVAVIERIDAVRGGDDKRSPWLTGPQVRRLVSAGLGVATRKERSLQFRAANLLRCLADDAGPQMHSEMNRTLLLAIEKHAPKIQPTPSEPTPGSHALKRALAMVPSTDASIAASKAQLFLADLGTVKGSHWSVYGVDDCLQGLARCVPALAGELRGQVLGALGKAAGNPEYAFMLTSGVRSPLQHYGISALAEAVPHLSAAELQAAQTAVEAYRQKVKKAVAASDDARSTPNKADLRSLFRAFDTAVKARRDF